MLTLAAGTMVLVIIVAIAIFLISKAIPALQANHENFFTFENWFPNEAEPRFGIAALAFGTVLSVDHRAARSRCRWRSASRSSSRTTPTGGSPPRSAS